MEAELASAEKEAVAGLAVITELLHCAPKLGHETLQNASARTALDGMKICSQQGQRSIQFLVEALTSPQAGPEVAQDAVYVLQKIATPCSTVKHWISAAGGMAAAEVVLAVHVGREELIRNTIWLVYCVEGLKGFVALLQSNQTKFDRPGLPDSAAAGIAWAIWDLTRQEQTEVEGDVAPEAGDLLRILVEVMRLRRQSYEVQWACCSALDALMYKDPRLGGLFLELGGAPLLLDVLQSASALDGKHENLACSCAYIVATLADGSSQHAEILRRNGAMQALAALSLRGRGSLDEEAAVWSLGQLGGLSAVLEAMAQAPRLASSSAVLRGGVEAIKDLTFKNEDVQDLPAVLGSLLAILQQDGIPVAPEKGAGALSSAAVGLSNHFAPGQLSELDRSVEALVHLVRADPPSNVAGTETAVEGLGRLALTAPAWREALKQCGTVELLSMHIRSGNGGRRLVKYCFWAAASLAGMPMVVHELRNQLRNQTPSSNDMVDAAFCTIIDIMDDDLDHEYVLRGAERCAEASVPDVLRLVAEAMQRHAEAPELQSRGCTAVALLVAVAPKEQVPPEAVTAVLAAARRHPKLIGIVSQACRALRAVLEQCFRDSNVAPVFLTEQGTEGVAKLAVKDFATKGDSELLEDATFVLASLVGIEAALEAIKEMEAAPVFAAGLKAIFELGRSRSGFLTGRIGSLAMSAGLAMAQLHPKDSSLQRAAELLVGHCGAHGCTPVCTVINGTGVTTNGVNGSHR